ncbi:MAG: toll/interleukin-1 receptor domain-containing protein [Pyrinomonadaceae bacterium]
MGISVFISHSTWPKQGLDPRLQAQLPGQSAFRKRLCDRLAREPGITVVVDEQIPAGRSWREFLFDGIAECSAAVVLVNEQALKHSPWVETEVKVLCYRAHNEKEDFRLIVVPFGGVTGAHIAGHASWEPVAIGEFQMLPRHGLDETDGAAVDALIEQIVDDLRGLPELVEGRSKSGWLVDRLCALLDIETHHLKEIGASLGADVAGVVSQAVLKRRVAHAIYSLGPQAIDKLHSNPYCRLDRETFEEILDILSTNWIDMAASAGILPCRVKLGGRRVIAINGKEYGFTPWAYVRQVCGQLTNWPVLTIEPTLDVVEQIRTSLLRHPPFRDRLARVVPNYDRAPVDRVMKGINKILDLPDSAPVFVALLQEGGGKVDDLIADIARAFPSINVIVCTGTERGEAVLPPGVQMLTPEFPLADEAKALDEYCEVGTHI